MANMYGELSQDEAQTVAEQLKAAPGWQVLGGTQPHVINHLGRDASYGVAAVYRPRGEGHDFQYAWEWSADPAQEGTARYSIEQGIGGGRLGYLPSYQDPQAAPPATVEVAPPGGSGT